MSDRIVGLRAMRVGISGRHLGEPGTPASIGGHLAALRAADVVQAAAKILIWMEEPGRDGLGVATQQHLADEIFPDEIATEVRRALDAGGDSEGFDAFLYPGQLLTLQKLALRTGRPGPPTSFDDGRLIWRFFLAAAQVGDVRDDLVDAEAEVTDEVGGALYAIRAAELNLVHFPPTVAGRAYRLWLDARVPWPGDVESPDSYCHRRFGTGVREFVAIAAAAPLGRLRVDLARPDSVPFSPEHYFAETTIDVEMAKRVLASLTYMVEPDPAALTKQENYWSFIDLADRPLMPCGTGLLVPCSLRYSLERATTGLFWMMHSANTGDVGRFTTHFGKLFEDYCRRCAEGLRSRSITVSGDLEYGPAGSRRRSPDVLITTASSGPPARIFVECRAGRPSAAVFTVGSREAFHRYLDDLVGKLVQLDRGICDHQHGRFSIPNDLAGANDSYLPMLVVDVPFHWTFLLRNLLDQAITTERLFRDPRVAKPVVCSVEEFESAIAACERGADLSELLRSYLATDRMDPFHHHIYSRTGPLRSPRFTTDGWETWQHEVRDVLFHRP